ncbi:adenine-specific methyltransferase EcoRI family protein [bacterium]|nr:adenine-specific methyltransferase EcoRI family protein [bacterium]
MAGNSDLNSAKSAKKDEFYTQLTDIEKELRHYRQHFQGKTVLCNCDDPFESNFFKYFVLNFNRLGLKKVIATCYTGSPIANQQLSLFDILSDKEENKEKPYKAVVTTVYDKTGDGSIDMLDVAELFKSGENTLTELEGDGDFRSPECLKLMDEADIVVTNPPFSLFREYVATLVEHNKKFIIIGNINAVTYKEFFPLIMNNKVWIGPSVHSGDRAFYVPDDYPLSAAGCGIDEVTGRKYIRVKGIRWFTNLDIKQRHEEMILVKKYSPELNQKYDNYDAINVDSTADIPCDYAGVMGVPITFLDKYCPDQFEIVGITKTWFNAAIKIYGTQTQVDKNGKKSLVSKLNDGPALKITELPKDKTYYEVDGEKYTQAYARVLIRNKHPEAGKD